MHRPSRSIASLPGIITLLTDFGTADGYVAEMKGVLLSAAPNAILVDVTHDIAPQDTVAARLVLERTWRRFPPDTVHLVVVDPGVGTTRRAIAVSGGSQFFVGPDNGVLSPALAEPGAECVELPIPARASPTFHGRDVFAPVAARLLVSGRLHAVGSPIANPTFMRTPEPRRDADGSLHGEVMVLDRFGNAVTNLPAPQGDGVHVEVNGARYPVRRTYGDAAPGEAIALVGSNGYVEIAVRDGSAAAALGLTRGMPLRLTAS